MTTQTLKPINQSTAYLDSLENRLAELESDIEAMRKSQSIAADDMIATYCTKARILRNRIARERGTSTPSLLLKT